MNIFYIETIRQRQHLLNSLMKLVEAKSLSFPLKSESWEQDLYLVYLPNVMVVNSKVYIAASLFLLEKNHSFNTIYGKYSADKW